LSKKNRSYPSEERVKWLKELDLPPNASNKDIIGAYKMQIKEAQEKLMEFYTILDQLYNTHTTDSVSFMFKQLPVLVECAFAKPEQMDGKVAAGRYLDELRRYAQLASNIEHVELRSRYLANAEFLFNYATGYFMWQNRLNGRNYPTSVNDWL
jgi:hypothetical protein